MFLDKGDIVYTKDGEVFEIGSDEKYAIDTFFNLYTVNKTKHDIQLLYEDVDFSYETWTKGLKQQWGEIPHYTLVQEDYYGRDCIVKKKMWEI